MDVVGRLHLHQKSIDDFAETDTNKVHKHIVFGKQTAGILMDHADKEAPAGWQLSEQQTNFKRPIPIGSNVVIVRECTSKFGEGADEKFVVSMAMYVGVPVEQEGGKRPSPYVRGSFEYRPALHAQVEEPKGKVYVLEPEIAKKVARALFQEKENVGALADAYTSLTIAEQGEQFLKLIEAAGHSFMYAKQNINYSLGFRQLKAGDRILIDTNAANPTMRQGRAPVYFVKSTATDQSGNVLYRANYDLMTISTEQLQKEITQKTA